MVRKTTPVSAVMMTVLLLLVCCDGVVANTATPDATYRLSGHASTSTSETNYSGPSGQVPSAALHLSGGGNIKVAPTETKAKKIVRKFLSKSGTFVLRRTRNNEQPSGGQDTRPHQPHYSVTHRQWHQNPSQQNLYEAKPPSVVLNYAHKNTALVSASHDCYVTKPTMPDSVSQQLSSKALVFMGLLALQFGVQPLLVRKFTSQGIIKSSIVLTQESIKFLVAAFLYLCGSNEQQRQQERAVWSVKSWLAVAALPAALYTVQNFASLLAYQHLEALTFNVLNQTKILSAAICCYLVMGKKQSRVQALSLLLLSGSALVIEKIVTLQTFRSLLGHAGGNGLLTTILNELASFNSSTDSRRFTHGILPVLLASFISGLAGALAQKNLQGAPSKSDNGIDRTPRNAYLFSMEMNAASAIILIVSLLFSTDGRSISQNGFFHQWTPKTLIPIMTNSLGGIVVGLVTKHAGSVQKGFALIFGLLLSGIIQVGSAGISTEQVIGGGLAALSLWLHTTHPHKSLPKTSLS